MSKYYIRFSLLKTCVRGKNEETYSLLMEENDLTIIFHPLTKVGEVFEDMYKSVSDVIKEVQDFDETSGYFSCYESDADENLIKLLNGDLTAEELPDYIELVGFEGLN